MKTAADLMVGGCACFIGLHEAEVLQRIYAQLFRFFSYWWMPSFSRTWPMKAELTLKPHLGAIGTNTQYLNLAASFARVGATIGRPRAADLYSVVT